MMDDDDDDDDECGAVGGMIGRGNPKLKLQIRFIKFPGSACVETH
jgi:hypothetical protein